MEVGPGDFVLVRGQWEEITSNTAYGEVHVPREWTIETTHGTYSMWDIDRYAKADELRLFDREQGSRGSRDSNIGDPQKGTGTQR